MFVYNEEKNVIETERLVLRRFVLEDAEKVAAICNTDEVWKGTLALPHPYTVDCGKSWIQTHDKNFADNRYYDFAITDKISGELYGCMGMAVDMNTNMGELGYWVGPSYWNRGIATEAACAMIEYGFRIKKFHKINATHYIYNPASGRVMEKAGMEKEGVRKSHVWKIDRFEDVAIYGIVNPCE